MTVCPQAHEVKQLVLHTFLELGAESLALFNLRETSLADRGRRVARTYRAGALRAVWSLDEGIVEIYDADGRLFRVMNLLREKAAQLAAA
jgi:hypothetical protein